MPRRKRHSSRSSGTFSISSPNVRHSRLFVWDLYEQIEPFSLWKNAWVESQLELFAGVPHFMRMLKEVAEIEGCLFLLTAMLIFDGVIALMPALKVYFHAEFLAVVNAAVETRSVDRSAMLRTAFAQVACSVMTQLLRDTCQFFIRSPLKIRIQRNYNVKTFSILARLDVPTFNDPSIQPSIDPSGDSVPWSAISTMATVASQFITLVSQLSVLANVLRNQPDGILLAVLSFLSPLWDWFTSERSSRLSGVWAATTTDENYIRAQGLKSTISYFRFRHEIVAGNMASTLTSQYDSALKAIGDIPMNFWTALHSYRQRKRSFSIGGVLQHFVKGLPTVVFALRVARQPQNIPISLASLHLISSTTQSFSSTLFMMLHQTASVAEMFASLKKMHNLQNIPNRIADGKTAYPEDSASLKLGIDVEFVRVSFRYPDSEHWALKDVSFRVGAGQLCVMVGPNGSGKSTVLKLIARLYDPTEGTILIDGRDIKTLKLGDLRSAIAVLFQDYTLFPLSIYDNIALGLPNTAPSPSLVEKVEEAAELAGAHSFLSELPEGYRTYLDRPVQDYYSELPEGTSTLFGRPVGYDNIRSAGDMSSSNVIGLSGGQEQRIALARTFMRSLEGDQGEGVGVGMLLFDEPSASLDPQAEHDLFQRLRTLRNSKTMLFSSHRFGNLTRHADVIIYIDNSTLLEMGTHDQLMQDDESEYARLWRLQAQAFL